MYVVTLASTLHCCISRSKLICDRSLAVLAFADGAIVCKFIGLRASQLHLPQPAYRWDPLPALLTEADGGVVRGGRIGLHARLLRFPHMINS